MGLPAEEADLRGDLGDRGEYLEVALHAAPGDGISSSPYPIRCAVAERWVITSADHSDNGVLDDFSASIVDTSAEAGEFSGLLFTAELYDWVVNSYVELFTSIETELEDFDARVLVEGGSGSEISKLAYLKSRLAVIRRGLARHRQAMMILRRPELQKGGTAQSGEWFADVSERLDDALEQGRELRASIAESFEIISTRAADRTSQRMTILTVVSVLLLPGSVIAGIMGMNFRVGLFRVTWMFWVVIAAILFIAAITLLTIKRRGWINPGGEPPD